jgi:NADH-quinone oxidoreductase subunit H
MRAPALLLLSAWLVVAALVTGCRAPAGPELLSAVEITPHEVDVGDRLQLVGSGFPDGKPATITFAGELDRSGQSPRRGVEIVARGASTSPNRVVFQLDEALRAEFCGRRARAEHTTFHGAVTVAFAPRDTAAPPITGMLSGVTLDVDAPPVPLAVEQQRRAEGERALAFLGLAVKRDATATSLAVTDVAARSRAARAGVLAGDVLLAFDGVRVHSPSDVIPRAGSASASLAVRRGTLSEPMRLRVDVQGFKQEAPTVLALPAVLVALFAAILLLFMGPSAGWITWLERRVALRFERRGRRDGPRGFFSWLLARLGDSMTEDASSGGERVLLRFVPYLLFLAASASFTLLAFGRCIVGVDLDLGLLLFSGTTALGMMGLMLSGWRSDGRWSLLGGLAGAFAVVSAQLPALMAVACVVLCTGSVRFEDIVLDQGGLPWRWHVFENPMLLLSFCLFLTALLPAASRASQELPELDGDSSAPPGTARAATRCLMFFAEWGNLFVLSGVGCLLFLGGFRLPFVSASAERASAGYQALGALLLQLKCWALVLLVLWLRWVLPRFSVRHTLRLCWQRLLPLSVLAFLTSFAWLAGLRHPILRSLEDWVSYVLFGLATFVAGYFARRVLVTLKARGPAIQLNINPWL